MRLSHKLFSALMLMPSFIAAATCPSFTCPDDRETPVVEYTFENGLTDTSGHNLHAGPMSPGTCLQTYHTGIGGRPGTVINGFKFGAYCGVSFPACSFWRDEGEIEWYQYLTQTVATKSNGLFWWCTNGCNNGGMQIYSGDGYINDPTAVRVQYTTWAGTSKALVQYGGQYIVYNTWQHYSFQWGSFGTRFIVDGVIRAGSYETWWQDPRDYVLAYFGTCIDGNSDLFMGYIDDFKIWPCAGHGTFTETPTLTPEKTHTVTPTCTITGTHTITETATITETCTFEPTLTVTETRTVSPTHTFSPTPSPTFTPQDTPTVTPTRSDTRFTGIFPNPVRLNAKIVFTSEVPCQAELILYNVAGETALVAAVPASAGLNAVEFEPKNSSGKKLASGVYLYRFELKQPGNTRIYAGKLAIAR